MGKKNNLNSIVAWFLFIISEVVATLMVYCLNDINTDLLEEEDLSHWKPHILLMVTSLIIINGHGMVIFRLLPGYVTRKIKYLHALIQTLAGGGAIYGYIDMYEYEPKYHPFRFHVIFASMTAFLYIMQWISAIFIYIGMSKNQRMRNVYTGWHNFMGIGIFLFSISTAVCMLQEINIKMPIGGTNAACALISIVSYGVLINSIVLNPYLEWPLVGAL